ncbi:Ankyrin repeat-containing protein [Spatholobus suberectus]|nr:Ankyrin repeat-containing protein [Spatholobus suberectus]
MTLQPSFACKLNREGYTPIHLALEHDRDRVVLPLVQINKDLIRAKGRGGFTPLHLASKKGKNDLLAKFLSICPDSIEDVNGKSETALHIALTNGQHRALQVLVEWLTRIPE